MSGKVMKGIINYLFVILFLIFPSANFAQDVKAILSKIPLKDRLALERLFYWIMQSDDASYTLFGDKPISLSGDFVITPIGNLIAGQKCGGVFWKHWEIWKKYESLFPHPKYLIIEEISCDHKDIANIVIINKSHFIKQVNRYINIFRKFLGDDVTGISLLHQIEKKIKFSSIIKDNQMLWGILLGYGLHNARLYYERDQLERFINFEDFPKVPKKKPTPTKNFSSIEEEYEYLNSKLRFFGDHFYSPLILRSVHFVADSEHPETKALEKKYQKLRGKISAIYAKGDFLEITLSKLISTD